MRTLLTYHCSATCFSLLCILSACTRTIETPATNPGEELYAIRDIEFFLAEDDTLDSTLARLDTVVFVNRSTSHLPDTTFYPYAAVKDSVHIALTDATQRELLAIDSISFRQMTVRKGDNGELSFFQQQDSIEITGFPATVTMPSGVHIAETFRPTPKTKYEMTGEYWRVRYSISFRAYAVRAKDGQSIAVDGKIWYATATVSGPAAQQPQPRATITIISDVE